MDYYHSAHVKWSYKRFQGLTVCNIMTLYDRPTFCIYSVNFISGDTVPEALKHRPIFLPVNSISRDEKIRMQNISGYTAI